MNKFIILAPEGVEFLLQRVPGMDSIMLIKTTDADCITINAGTVGQKVVVEQPKAVSVKEDITEEDLAQSIK